MKGDGNVPDRSQTHPARCRYRGVPLAAPGGAISLPAAAQHTRTAIPACPCARGTTAFSSIVLPVAIRGTSCAKSPAYDPPEAISHRPPGTALAGANVGRLWEEALPADGTAAAEYLDGRSLRLPLDDIRFHPRCPWGPKPSTRFLPALIVAVREGSHLRAIQRIFLDTTNGGYLDKVMLGAPAAGAWQGGRAGETLAIAEGFENGCGVHPDQLHTMLGDVGGGPP